MDTPVKLYFYASDWLPVYVDYGIHPIKGDVVNSFINCNRDQLLISSKISSDEHITIIDVDDIDSLQKVTTYLDKHRIKYNLVHTSLSRFWVIADYIDSFVKLIPFLKSIPGIDEEYLRLSIERKHLLIRATAMNKSKDLSTPCVSECKIGSRRFKEFNKLLKDYFESDIYKAATKQVSTRFNLTSEITKPNDLI